MIISNSFFSTVPDHILEFRPIVRLGRESPIDIMPQYGDPVLLGKSCTLPELSLYAFLSLIIGGIARINHSLHAFASESIFRIVFFSFSFIVEPGSKHISTNRFISGSSSTAFG